MRYQNGDPFPEPIGGQLVAFDSPAIRWTVASKLVRELFECTIVNLDDELAHRTDPEPACD